MPRRHLGVMAILAVLAASCGSTDGQGTATLQSEAANSETAEAAAGTETTAAPESTTTSTSATEPAPDAETETVDVFRLREGECLLLPTQGITGEEVETLEAIPCDQPHDGEVLSIEIVPGGDDAPYPGEASISADAETGCLASFRRVTGRDFATDPFWDLTFLSPTAESWTLGNDREIVCIVLPLDGGLTTDLVTDNLAG